MKITKAEEPIWLRPDPELAVMIEKLNESEKQRKFSKKSFERERKILKFRERQNKLKASGINERYQMNEKEIKNVCGTDQ